MQQQRPPAVKKIITFLNVDIRTGIVFVFLLPVTQLDKTTSKPTENTQKSHFFRRNAMYHAKCKITFSKPTQILLPPNVISNLQLQNIVVVFFL